MRCIAVINQKGGVGKTTSTVNIGAALARAGHRVLLLDMDPQANLSLHLDRQPADGDARTMTDMLVDDLPLAEMLHETATAGLFVVPADTSLSGVETVLANRIGRETILRDAIAGLDAHQDVTRFDFILLDCPPSLGVLSANALVAADHVVIPMQAEYFSMQGMTKLLEVMQLVRKALNPGLQIGLILPCMVDRRTNLTTEVLNELQAHFGEVLAETCIRSNVKLAEAPSFGRTIFEHAPECNGAYDYEVVTDELLRRHAGTFVPAPPEAEWEDEGEDDAAADEHGEAAADTLAGIEADSASPTPQNPTPASPATASPEATSPQAASPETASPETASPEAAAPQAAAPRPEPARQNGYRGANGTPRPPVVAPPAAAAPVADLLAQAKAQVAAALPAVSSRPPRLPERQDEAGA